jgi:hypothetical protein
MFTFNVSLIHVFHLIQQHYLMLNGDKILGLHNFLIQGLTSKQRQHLQSMTRVMLLIYVLVCGFCCWMYFDFIVASDETALIIFNFYAPIPVKETSKTRTVIAYYLMLFYFAWIRNAWQMTSCMLYYYLLMCLSFLDDSMKTSVLSHRNRDDLNFEIILRERIKLKSVKESFESLVSPFPFLWFTFNFVSLISILVVLFRLGFSSSFPTETILSFFNVFLTFVILNLVTKINLKGRRLSNQVLESLYRDGNIDAPFKVQVIHDLRNNPVIELTACGFFSLERQVIPSFVGALISFAVLFVQVSEMKKGEGSNSMSNATATSSN